MLANESRNSATAQIAKTLVSILLTRFSPVTNKNIIVPKTYTSLTYKFSNELILLTMLSWHSIGGFELSRIYLCSEIILKPHSEV
jgi:hypothetical protein